MKLLDRSFLFSTSTDLCLNGGILDVEGEKKPTSFFSNGLFRLVFWVLLLQSQVFLHSPRYSIANDLVVIGRQQTQNPLGASLDHVSG